MAAHRVNSLEVELTTGERALAEALIERIGQLHERRIAPTLDRTFSALSPPGQIDRLERLELDLGTLPADDFDDAFIHALEAAVRTALSRAIGERPTNRRTDVARELLAIFARTGNLPWWTDDGDPDTTPADPVAAALATLSRDAPRDLLALLHELADDPPALARLARHGDDTTLAPLLAHRWPAASADLLAAARWLAHPPGDEDPIPASWRPHVPLLTALAHPDLDPASALNSLLSDLARTLRTSEQALLPRLARAAHTHDAPALLREHLAPFLEAAHHAGPPEHAPQDMPPETSPARPSPADLRPALNEPAAPDTREHAPPDMPPETPTAPRSDSTAPTESPAPSDEHTTPAPVPWAAAHADAALDPTDATATDPNAPDPSATDPNAPDPNAPNPREPLDPSSSLAPESPDPDTHLAPESPDPDASRESTDPNAPLAARSLESLALRARHAREPADPNTRRAPDESTTASPREPTPNEPLDTGAALEPRDHFDPSVAPTTIDPRAPASRPSAPHAPPVASATTDPRATADRPTDPHAAPPEPPDAPATRPHSPDPAASRPASRTPSASPPRSQPRRPAPPLPPHVLAARRQALAQLDELYIDDAGLVILWPFLARLFERAGLFDDQRVFLDDAARTRAIALLAWLAREDPDPPEFLLPLPKLLCGLAPDARFELPDPLDPELLSEGERLLAAVIDHAPVLRDMSIPGFRATFLRRRGVLAVRDGAWLLRVERAPHDLVLERFPWSWSWLKLPWMLEPLRVEW